MDPVTLQLAAYSGVIAPRAAHTHTRGTNPPTAAPTRRGRSLAAMAGPGGSSSASTATDLGVFGEPGFDARAWINAACASKAPGEPLERFLAGVCARGVRRARSSALLGAAAELAAVTSSRSTAAQPSGSVCGRRLRPVGAAPRGASVVGGCAAALRAGSLAHSPLRSCPHAALPHPPTTPHRTPHQSWRCACSWAARSSRLGWPSAARQPCGACPLQHRRWRGSRGTWRRCRWITTWLGVGLVGGCDGHKRICVCHPPPPSLACITALRLSLLAPPGCCGEPADLSGG
jgi:hypothetical protein